MYAPEYNVGRDYDIEPDADYLSSDSYWIMAVVRVGVPLSFDRIRMKSVLQDVALGAMTRTKKPLVITDDILHVSMSHSKRSHTGTLNAVMKDGSNYLLEILPGDYVFCWLLAGRGSYERVLRKINSGAPCNDFKDGLKFFGRAHSIQKHVEVEPHSGVRRSSISLQAVSFSEMDSQIYYDWNLAHHADLVAATGQWMTRIGLEVDAIFRKRANGNYSDNAGLLIAAFVDLILGNGPHKDFNQKIEVADGQNVTRSIQAATSAPFAYLVPLQVGAMFGVKGREEASRVLCYGDILERVIGIQTYSTSTGLGRMAPDSAVAERRFRDGGADPDEVQETEDVGRHHETGKNLKGTFLPMIPAITNVPLWSLVDKFLNRAINEAYTVLKADRSGKIRPTLVARQIPFTTNAFERSHEATRFLNLPRWVLPPVMVESLTIGRSDQTRFNFVHVYGESLTTNSSRQISRQMVENPPRRDDIDIMRSGIRSYMTTVDCLIDGQIMKAPSLWTDLIADFLIGSHLAFNGSITCKGIQSPIAVGDNVLFDKVVYHIEDVSHQAGIGPLGEKQWSTTLELTNGMRALSAEDDGMRVVRTADGRSVVGIFPAYPGFDQMDHEGFDPGYTFDQQTSTGGSTADEELVQPRVAEDFEIDKDKA